jgi:hypothetical protein
MCKVSTCKDRTSEARGQVVASHNSRMEERGGHNGFYDRTTKE